MSFQVPYLENFFQLYNQEVINSHFEQITRYTIDCSITSLNWYAVHHIFPAESGRPYLKHIENVENSDYINACYVDVSVLMKMSFWNTWLCVYQRRGWKHFCQCRRLPLCQYFNFIVNTNFLFFLSFNLVRDILARVTLLQHKHLLRRQLMISGGWYFNISPRQ
jgi:hypothetical protein